MRSAAPVTGVDGNTIMKARVIAGERCGRLLNERVRRVASKRVQLDEIWTYLLVKEAHKTAEHGPETGDQYVFVGMDADSKLVLSHSVGKRDFTTAHAFVADIKGRLANRVQLTTGGFKPYLNAVDDAFGADVDYAMLVKMYGGDRQENAGPAWYGPAKVIGAMPQPITGNPDWQHISTSYIERQNLTMRMQMRRFTRLTNGFSKKLANLKAQVALHFAYYNFCRIRRTLRVTPAMEAGLTDHVWQLKELLA